MWENWRLLFFLILEKSLIKSKVLSYSYWNQGFISGVCTCFFLAYDADGYWVIYLIQSMYSLYWKRFQPGFSPFFCLDFRVSFGCSCLKKTVTDFQVYLPYLKKINFEEEYFCYKFCYFQPLKTKMSTSNLQVIMISQKYQKSGK